MVKFSTASMSGAVATRQLFLFSSEKSPSKAWQRREAEDETDSKTLNSRIHLTKEREVTSPLRFAPSVGEPVLLPGRAEPHLDSFDQVGCAVGHLLGRLDKMSLGSWVGCLG